MTHATGAESAWRQGTLNDEEFERAAMAFRPSWEVGLDAARRASIEPIAPAPAETERAGGFSAAKVIVRDSLVEGDASAGLAAPPEKPVAKPAAAPVTKPARATPAVNARPIDDHEPAPAPRKNTLLYGLIAGAVAVIALIGYFALGSNGTGAGSAASVSSAPSSEQSAPAPSQLEAAPTAAPAPEPAAPAAPEPAAPAPEPAVAAPEPAPAVAAPAPEPSPAVAAPEPAAVTAPHREVHRVAAPRPAPPRRPAPARSRNVGVGFETDNPY